MQTVGAATHRWHDARGKLLVHRRVSVPAKGSLEQSARRLMRVLALLLLVRSDRVCNMPGVVVDIAKVGPLQQMFGAGLFLDLIET